MEIQVKIWLRDLGICRLLILKVYKFYKCGLIMYYLRKHFKLYVIVCHTY